LQLKTYAFNFLCLHLKAAIATFDYVKVPFCANCLELLKQSTIFANGTE
jgi:hypothetical protein